MTDLAALDTALRELRALLARPDNDFTWSSWIDQDAALAELDGYLAQIGQGRVPELSILLLPTGPAQEVSLSSGWGEEYLAVAGRLELVLART